MAEKSTFLLATDGSEPARQAERKATKLADPETVKFLVVSVDDLSEVLRRYGSTGGAGPEFLSPQYIDKIDKEIREETSKRAQSVVERLESDGFEVESVVESGPVGRKIVEVAEQHDVEVIVMGRKGAGQLAEMIMGSVSSYVVHHSDRSVLLVPSPNE